MVDAKDIGWGSYKEFEGPFFRGSAAFVLPSSPVEADRILAVITATEGGHYDAYNGYDRCISTSGLIQFCEAGQYSVSDMLGAVATSPGGAALLTPLLAWTNNIGVVFRPNAKGRWRFHFTDARGEVDTTPEQQQLFLLTSNGKKGTWDNISRAYAKGWAAAISSVWQNPAAAALQRDWTAQRLNGFMLGEAKSYFAQAPDTALARALKAAYLSFAANNPTWANNAVKTVSAPLSAMKDRFELPGVTALLKELTFGAGVVIYPGRYDKIRPVLEKLYGINLPDVADDLRHPTNTGAPSWTTANIQQALITLGYDLGPAQADGVWGGKSSTALRSFEEAHSRGVPDGKPDADTLKLLQDVLLQRGLSMLPANA